MTAAVLPLTVLHCIPGMGGGGAERQLAYLAGPLADRGWSVHVAMTAGGPNLARLESGGAAVHMLDGWNSHDPRLAWQLARIFRRIRPHIVQTWFVQMDVLAGLASELLRVPLVLSERSSELAYPASPKNAARIAVGRRADAIIANSAAGDDYWQARGVGRSRRHVVPNAVPLEEIESTQPGVPPGLSIPGGDDVVMFAGRFGVEKNTGVLIDALAQIVRRPATTAVLCGEGPLLAGARQDIAARGLAGRILTPGYVTDPWALMKRSAAVVAPSLFEGRPNTVIEAMAAGTPLVVSDIPAHREILDAESAVWVDPSNVASIASAVLGVLTDRAGAIRRATAARARASAWSVEAAARAYDRVYRGVLTQRHPQGRA